MKNSKVMIRLLLYCVLAFNLTACSNQQNIQTADTVSQSTSSESNINISDGNTISENKKLSGKCNNIKLGNRTIDVPVSVKELGEDYNISSSSIEYSENDSGTFNAKFDIVHNDVVVLKACVKDVADYSQKDYTDLSNIKIVDMEQQYVPKNGEVLSVNNAAVGDKPENVIKNLGKADKTTGCSYIYYNNGEKDNGAIFVFDDYNGVYYIRWYYTK